VRLRDRYHFSGPADFSDIDLLACVIGQSSAVGSGREVAARLVDRFGGLAGLARCEPRQLVEVVGIGPERAMRVHAALELGQRSLRSAEPGPSSVRHPDDARAWLVPALTGLRHEELHGLFLDRRRRVLARRCLTVGSDSFTVVDPRQIFRTALAMGAEGVVLAHNHPSGDPEPSRLDHQVTQRVEEAGRVVGIVLVDHLVVGSGESRSFAEQGWLGTEAGGASRAAVRDRGRSDGGW